MAGWRSSGAYDMPPSFVPDHILDGHICRYPVEHRTNGKPILMECRICEQPAIIELMDLRAQVAMLTDQLHQLTKQDI